MKKKREKKYRITHTRLPTEKEKGIFPPKKGWKSHSIYLVEVCFRPENPIHQAYLITGFINEGKTGLLAFGGYCKIVSESYEQEHEPQEVHYMKSLGRLKL